MKTILRLSMLLAPLTLLNGVSLWAEEAAPQAPSSGAESQVVESDLILGDDVAGEVSIRDDDGELVAQLYKREGHEVSIPLEPGTYAIECVTEPQFLHAEIKISEDERVVVNRDRLHTRDGKAPRVSMRRKPKRERPSRPAYNLRPCRLTMDMGVWTDGGGKTSIVINDDGIESRNGGFLGGMSFGLRVTPEWMMAFGVTSRLIEAHDAHWYDAEDIDRASFLTSVTVGARYYLSSFARRSVAKPYVSAGIGPTFGTEVESREWRDSNRWRRHDRETVRSEAVFGGYLGAGIDLHPTGWLVLGSDVTYHISPKLSEEVGGRRETNGFAFAFQVGASFGRRLPKRDER
jgi:hypothetical protein